MANTKAKIAPTCEGANRVNRGLPKPSPPLAPALASGPRAACSTTDPVKLRTSLDPVSQTRA
eukprot:14689523-Alexandrium_andersonii.AAC.1